MAEDKVCMCEKEKNECATSAEETVFACMCDRK